MPELEAMLMMAPEPWRSITGSACLQPRKTLFRLKSTCASQTSSDISTGPPAAEPPTLLTRMSRRPKCSTQAATISATALPSVTSHRCARMSVFAAFSVSTRRSACRSTAKIFAPSSAKRAAIARPLPQPGPTEPAPVTMATLPLSLEPIEPCRVVDQQRLALFLGGSDFGEVVHHDAVVGNLFQVRMRPVGAPDRLRGELLDQLARERNGVLPRRRLARYSFAAADLHPDGWILQKRNETGKIGLVESLGCVDPADVVDHDRHRRALERRGQIGKDGAFRVDLQMPADVRELGGEGDHLADRRGDL